MINYLVFNTIFSTVHATIMFLMSYYNVPNYIFINGLKFSVIYNLVDMIIMENSKIKKQMLLHHILLIIAALYGITYPTKEILDIVYLGYITEITTPFLNMAWFYNLKKNKTKLENRLFLASSITTFILYLPCRVLLTSYISYKVQFIECSIKPIVYGFTLLNYIWYYKMCKKFKSMMM